MADSPWDMLSAVGTLAAVVVALGVSLRSGWTSRRMEKDRSELAAAKMLSPLSALEKKASYLSAIIAFRDEGSTTSDTLILKCLDDLEDLAKSISMEDLYPLLHLPKHAAKRASRSLGLIQPLVSEARSILTYHSWADFDKRQKTAHYDRWMSMLSEIKDLLIIAVSACEIAASSGAPRPSREEIHGDPTAE
ncbi:hypothetical protein CP336_18710 [Pseudomonas fluorescens]|nr:hypothetical protein CP336_18710 [Pseudomonas fluorescens]